jgi:tRNA(Ile)-lysidine synthase
MRTGRNPEKQSALRLNTELLRPGMRVAVGLSGGADSVALLRVLAEQRTELGIVLYAAHLHHGLRGAEADGDLEFCRELAAVLGVEFHEARADVEALARANAEIGKPAESIEEAARRLRYGWFRTLLAEVPLDAVATAHTLDDQAETVLAKLLRGAWTEGLSGIHPMIQFPEGKIVRPLLEVRRTEIEAYLGELGQHWREDSTNLHLTYTRNRIRHELLPLLEGWNPKLREHLAQMAELAREEEIWWAAELARLAPQLLMSGRAVRGGGRASASGAAEALAVDGTRLAALAPAVQRRLLRLAAGQLGAAPDFAATEALRKLAIEGGAGQKLELAGGLRAERSPRELRLSLASAVGNQGPDAVEARIPGLIEAPAFQLRLRVEVESSAAALKPESRATLRAWKAGDRVRLRYTSGPRKVKEVLERMKVTGSSRGSWPVLEVDGRIVWMQGVELEPEPGLLVTAHSRDETSGRDEPAG